MSEKVGMAQWYGYPIFTPLPQGSTPAGTCPECAGGSLLSPACAGFFIPGRFIGQYIWDMVLDGLGPKFGSMGWH